MKRASAHETLIKIHRRTNFPGARAIPEFSEELKGYNTSKGTIQFPIDKPMPLDLITKITKFCVEQRNS